MGTAKPIITQTVGADLLGFNSNNSDYGIRILNLELRGGGVGGRGIYLSDDKRHWLICNNTSTVGSSGSIFSPMGPEGRCNGS